MSTTQVSCSALIYNEHNHLLVIRRTDDAPKNPGKWETPGGGLEFGESPEECVRREVREEVALELDRLSLFRVYSYRQGDEHVISIIFTGKAVGQVKPNSREVQAFNWITEADITSLDFCDHCIQRVTDFFRGSA